MMNVVSILKIQFLGTLVATLALVIIYETDVVEPGLMAGADEQLEFYLLAFMELLTIALIPWALRLFKMKKVDADLRTHHEIALKKWGVIRQSMLEILLVLNTLFYYLFLNTSFGYMAIIVVLAMFFVYPSRERCETESFRTHTNENA